jgi:hypothetical protein
MLSVLLQSLFNFLGAIIFSMDSIFVLLFDIIIFCYHFKLNLTFLLSSVIIFISFILLCCYHFSLCEKSTFFSEVFLISHNPRKITKHRSYAIIRNYDAATHVIT